VSLSTHSLAEVCGPGPLITRERRTHGPDHLVLVTFTILMTHNLVRPNHSSLNQWRHRPCERKFCLIAVNSYMVGVAQSRGVGSAPDIFKLCIRLRVDYAMASMISCDTAQKSALGMHNYA
jgi:hypothetical protein